MTLLAAAASPVVVRAGTPPTERLADHGNWKDGAFKPPA